MLASRQFAFRPVRQIPASDTLPVYDFSVLLKRVSQQPAQKLVDQAQFWRSDLQERTVTCPSQFGDRVLDVLQLLDNLLNYCDHFVLTRRQLDRSLATA